MTPAPSAQGEGAHGQNFGRSANGLSKHQRAGAPFLPSWLDEFGLRPNAFRVLLHLARRAGRDGYSYPSAASIARVCKINRDTVFVALNELEAAGLILRFNKPGRSNDFRVVFPPRHHPAEKDGHHPAERDGLPPAEKEGHHPAEKEGHEGNPGKAIHNTAAGSRSVMDGEAKEAGTSKARGAQNPGTSAPDSAPSRATSDKPGVCDRDNSGQPARPEPVGWRTKCLLYSRREEDWSQFTPAEQCHCWQIIDPANPAADYDGWPTHVAGRRAA